MPPATERTRPWARTVPISAGQPPDTTRTAAGQVVRAAAAQAVAMQAASLALAALLRPLTPAATRTCSRSPRPPAAALARARTSPSQEPYRYLGYRRVRATCGSRSSSRRTAP